MKPLSNQIKMQLALYKRAAIIAIFTLVQTISSTEATSGALLESVEDVSSWQNNVTQPLYLTPLIKDGKLELARNKSRVGHLNGTDIVTYSGYLTVNDEFNSNMFFWYFPSLDNNASAPLILWLDGGPGSSSMSSIFTQIGPFVITSDMTLEFRNETWAENISLLYIENPVGSGFSYTEHEEGYATNQSDVARDLYEALQQFFTVFHDERHNDFYAVGVSYAGKYIPALGSKIHMENQHSEFKINLKGIAIGNGNIDLYYQNCYGDFLYNLGLIDHKQKMVFEELQEVLKESIKDENYTKAVKTLDLLITGQIITNSSYFEIFTGMGNLYNFLISANQSVDDNKIDYYEYLNLTEVRQAIHVGDRAYTGFSLTVQNHLLEDLVKSEKKNLELLINNDYKVMLYVGQMDIIISYIATVNLIQNLNWTKADEYENADRIIWQIEGSNEISGYVKKIDNFYDVLVRNAGHSVPRDQAKVAKDMIYKFIFDQPF